MEDYLFNWNSGDSSVSINTANRIFFDETLRDGIQAPGVRQPTCDEKFEIINHMLSVGIGAADLGFPGASLAAKNECVNLSRYLSRVAPSFLQAYAGRTHEKDISAIREVADTSGVPVDAYLFIGVSPIRQYVEGWSLESVKKNIREAARLCRSGNLNFVLVLEDALRCTPAILECLYSVAMEEDIARVALCDTVGCAMPQGVQSIVRWTQKVFLNSGYEMALDWHGHNDRGTALINSLVAAESGCSRIHGTVLGVGERAGNASLDQLIVNHHLENGQVYNLIALKRYCEYAEKILETPIPRNYPAMGADVFKTSAGVHASAILKAYSKGDYWMRDYVYSSVPASDLDRKQEVQINCYSGISNVKYWLATRGYTQDPKVIQRILDAAKSRSEPLCNSDIKSIIKEQSVDE